MKYYLKKFLKKEDGATMVEYAIMVSLIAIISVIMVSGIGQSVNSTFSAVNSALINPG